MRRGLIAALFVLVGGMFAPQIAGATVLVGQTNLTIHVRGGSVEGKLVGNPACRGDQSIDLYVDGVLVDSTTTDGAGNYAFGVSLFPPTDVQTRFAGSRTGVHPDRFICEPANSRIVIVKKVHGAQASVASPRGAATALAARVQAFGMALARALHR